MFKAKKTKKKLFSKGTVLEAFTLVIVLNKHRLFEGQLSHAKYRHNNGSQQETWLWSSTHGRVSFIQIVGKYALRGNYENSLVHHFDTTLLISLVAICGTGHRASGVNYSPLFSGYGKHSSCVLWSF